MNEPTPQKPRIYCAGPLFNQAERDEMTAIAEVLTEAGYPVFLPHRDGMEFSRIHRILQERNWPALQAAEFLHAAIFALDVYQLVIECGGVVWNLNGRVPDEGAVSEAAIAWTLGKPMVAYCDDVRSLVAGQHNPLLVGLVDFCVRQRLEEIPPALAEEIGRASARASSSPAGWPPKMQRTLAEGRRLWQAMTAVAAAPAAAAPDEERIADVVSELFAPQR